MSAASLWPDFAPYLGLALFALAALAYTEWEGRIRPGRIAEEDIRKAADELQVRYGVRAEEIAFINEDRAWRRSDVFEQETWRRIGTELRLRVPGEGQSDTEKGEGKMVAEEGFEPPTQGL